MNDETRQKVLGFAAFMTALVLLWWVCGRVADGAEITGPERVEVGRLAVFESATEGDFTVYPRAGGCFAKDSNRKVLYFASPECGQFTIIFFGLEEGQPVISTCDFTVEKVEPEPQPTPIVTGLNETEKTALKTAAEAVLKGIQGGVVRQPNHARMEWKRLINQQLSGKISDEVQTWLKRWSDEHEIATLDEVKATLTEMLEVLK